MTVAVAVVSFAMLSACSGGELAAPDPYAPELAPFGDPQAFGSSGAVRVAYPEEPSAWYAPFTVEPAAGDLGSLWSLPLYRVDADGNLRPALAEGATSGTDDRGWHVDVALRAGTWSDGTPVSARDVVATVDALKAAPETAAEFAPLVAAEALEDRVVRLVFDAPYGRWPYLLSAGSGVLPAHVLAVEGLEAFRGAPPSVTGGPFSVASYEPGRRIVLEAHGGTSEGAPGLARIDVSFVPDVDTALGLLAREEVDVALGYVALNPVARAEEVEGVRAAAPLGGTALWLRWTSRGALAGESQAGARQRARDAIDVAPQVEGLLGAVAEVATSLLPGQPGPWGGDAAGPDLSGVQPSLLVPRWQEATAFTARAVQRDLRTYGGGAELIRLESDALATSTLGDGVLELRRDVPWPSLVRAVAAGGEAAEAAARAIDRAPFRGAPEVAAPMAALYDASPVLPLYRIGVLHAWRPVVEGVTPSSWAGAGFWNARTWTLVEG